MAYNILIVDDSATMRTIVKRTLQMAQVPTAEVLEAGSGREALDVLKQKKVDLVLTDLNMPEMTGMEMIGQMRGAPALAAIPVVVISTEASTVRVEELLEKGARAYVHKPFTPEKIRTVVMDILGGCHAANH
jgi:two-component system, chemotaxis family, chemotaxis protein CheY